MKSHEWTVYDSSKEDFVLVRATSQKKAAVRGAELGCVPRNTNDVRPRTGDANLMTVDEYENWFQNYFKT